MLFSPAAVASATVATIDALPATVTPLAAAIDVASNLQSTSVIVASALASATALAAGSDKGPQEPPPNGECKLLGSFALLVQAALGGLALLALVYKRWRERPQRPMLIWTFDVSKQVVGSVLVHMANLFMSMLSSGQLAIKLGPEHISEGSGSSNDDYQPNPCSFYLLNLAIDTTIGIPILILLLRLFTALFLITPLGNPPESIRSGNYGQPPRAAWWFKQSIIYFFGLLGMKICVLIVFLVLPWISRVGDWALRWTEGNEQLQIFFVMLFFPVVMNATQYYIIDSFIKNQKPDVHEPLSVDDDQDGDHTGLFEDPGTEIADSVQDIEDDEDARKESVEIKPASSLGKRGWRGLGNYDLQLDGEGSLTVVGSASNSEREQLLGNGGADSDEERQPARR